MPGRNKYYEGGYPMKGSHKMDKPNMMKPYQMDDPNMMKPYQAHHPMKMKGPFHNAHVKGHRPSILNQMSHNK